MEPRTSTTRPLEIDELTCGAGVVGMTLCPGKRTRRRFGAWWERDLAIDMRVIVNWGATSLVTLMEGPELEKLGVGISELSPRQPGSSGTTRPTATRPAT